MSELKPCPSPFSAKHLGQSLEVYTSPNDGGFWWVQCLKCGMRGPTMDTRAEAITAWNTRPSSPVAGSVKRWVKYCHPEGDVSMEPEEWVPEHLRGEPYVLYTDHEADNDRLQKEAAALQSKLEEVKKASFVRGAKAMHNAVQKCAVVELKTKGNIWCGYEMGEVDSLTVEYLQHKEEV